ncbi:MAG TPA: RtcB family protein [Candidatus Omnitrophota bacterium]|nr:RtcB family protein [Candidatus Omnitrophota bacterium]
MEKIDDHRWRIPRSYKPGMRVPGLIFADEKLLKDIRHDKALEQVANVAFLPGIVEASMAMPDIHWGYGPSIGAVFATDIEANGVITPGGVGFDINCLSGEAKILHRFGYTMPIQDFIDIWRDSDIQCFDLIKEQLKTTKINLFLAQRPKSKVFRFKSSTGKEIIATADHPFYTPDGMKDCGRLVVGDRIAIYPFDGVPYEHPGSRSIVTESSIEGTICNLGKSPESLSGRIIIQKLKDRGLLPLTADHPKLPYLLKIMGMVFGDGTMNFIGKKGDGIVAFYGKKEDLCDIKEDLTTLGYTSVLHSQFTKLFYKRQKKTFLNWNLTVNASSLVVLLAALGVPVGRKVSQTYRVPQWIVEAPLWQKRLFLGSYFGAELTRPRNKSAKRGNFCAPVLSLNKREVFLWNGIAFLEDIAKLAEEFAVRCTDIVVRRKLKTRSGEISDYIELIFSSQPESLINLWGRIGFEYNRFKMRRGNQAVQYLRLKRQVIARRIESKSRIVAFKSSGLTYKAILEKISDESIGSRFIQSVIQRKEEDFCPRIPHSFPSYEEFLVQSISGLGDSMMMWDRIAEIEETVVDFVYDFNVICEHHNFVANNFVVSNCGVRLIKTDLLFDDIKDRIKDLTHALFSGIPAGVGSEGDIRVSSREEKHILLKGSRWAVEQGYGTEADIECTEESGCMDGADPDAVSDRAYERGRSQSGTLGSGNHFLEVQVIDQLYDRGLCDEFGFDLGQVTVMIHSGSRGFGYQVCDDYVKSMIRCLEKYHINVPDRQLACAPVGSAEGKAYLGAMKCAANYGWANRQCLMHLTRKVFEKFFASSWEKLGMRLIYDVAHNIAKIETHTVKGKKMKLCVHRKGATRAFGPGQPGVPDRYQKTGQPVIIPGDMGRNSYMLVGTQAAMDETFGSTCHGAGRLKSRSAALRAIDPNKLLKDLASKGITVLASGRGTIVEEAPEVYKDVNDVVNVVHNAGISKRVCRMRPLGVIKG